MTAYGKVSLGVYKRLRKKPPNMNHIIPIIRAVNGTI